MLEDVVEQFGRRLKYTHREMVQFLEKGHRIRHVKRLSKAAPLYSIEAEVIKSRHCNSGHIEGQKFIMDIDGNFITKHCPKKMCVYLISQLAVPVALINERLSEGLEPNSLEGKILSDADKLDAIGAIGVFRAIAQAESEGGGMEAFLRHADEKLLKLRDLMYTEPSRVEAKKRHSTLEAFVSQLRSELA